MRAGIYARVSVLHGTQKDLTVENQILLAEQYLREWQDEPIEISYYIDRGYSGTNFRRPSFLRMVRESEQGRLDLIVAKDLSRLGRNYLELGWYLEKVFPDAGVRVVTLGEGYDNANPDNDNLTAGIRNLMNEWYARETGRKVRHTKEWLRMEGNYLGSKSPYGYKIIYREGKRILIPDAAYPVRKEIYRLHREGKTSSEIARILSERRIATPEQYRLSGCVCFESEEKIKKWSSAMVRGLWNHEYEEDF
ncbi:MAG: recombinase family protein [Lachnospiraceae bacterium]|nr:recombinase family protein [Lachnospiraceae bacterium]